MILTIDKILETIADIEEVAVMNRCRPPLKYLKHSL